MRTGIAQHRWRILNLRLAMILIAAIALGLGYVCNRAASQAQAVAAIRRAGGDVMYDDQFAISPKVPEKNRWCPQWLIDRVGVDYFSTPVAARVSCPQVGDAELTPLVSLGKLQSLNIDTESIGMGGLVRLGEMRRLERLIIHNTPLGDDDLKHLEGLKQLRMLVLVDTKVSDEAAQRLRLMLPGLEVVVDRTK